jgi:hypothetical protein
MPIRRHASAPVLPSASPISAERSLPTIASGVCFLVTLSRKIDPVPEDVSGLNERDLAKSKLL